MEQQWVPVHLCAFHLEIFIYRVWYSIFYSNMLIVSISKIVKRHVCLVKTRGQPVAGKETLKKNSKLSEVFDIFHYLALKDSSEVFQIFLSLSPWVIWKRSKITLFLPSVGFFLSTDILNPKFWINKKH